VFSNIQKIRLNYSSNDVKNEKAQVLLNLCTIKIFLTRGTDEDLLNQPTNQPTNGAICTILISIADLTISCWRHVASSFVLFRFRQSFR